MASNKFKFPRAPFLDWKSFAHVEAIDLPSVADLPNYVITTSGRAALYHALLQLDLPTGATILVPTYHCPTMVAPVVLAGFNIGFYPLDSDGLPDIAAIVEPTIAGVGAIIVAHYFGLAKPLTAVRAWCDRHGLALIEDCAHCLFGFAGDQAIGTWGDFATASFSKFLPVPEAGLLASGRRKINPILLGQRRFSEQIKGLVDVLELSGMHGGFKPLNSSMNFLFELKNSHKRTSGQVKKDESPVVEETMLQCDMGRIKLQPLWISKLLSTQLPIEGNIEQRRQNFAGYLEAFSAAKGARPLYSSLHADAVPYVFPLWVEDCDRVYTEIRARQLPVFRWDKIWPGTPEFPEDLGACWNKNLLQLLCHQSLHSSDISTISHEIKSLL